MSYLVALIICLVLVIYNCRLERHIWNEMYLTKETTSSEKGIAAILIVFHHISQNIHVPRFCSIMGYIGFIMVAVFFFVSGYGLVFSFRNKPEYLNSFFRKRMLPILIPYWIINIIVWTKDIVSGCTSNIGRYVLSIFGFDTAIGTWFVTSILIMYILFWISFKLFEQNAKRYIFLNFLLFVYCIVCTKMRFHTAYTASIAAFAAGMLWFEYGNLLINWIRTKYVWKCTLCIVMFTGMFMGRLFLSYLGMNNEILHIILRNITSVLFVLVILVITQKIQFKGRLLVWLGSISYELYLVHVILIRVNNPEKCTWFIAIVLGGGIALATLLHEIDSRIITRLN